jgi:hypothetical protein
VFKLAKKRTVLWPVTVQIPMDEGKTQAQVFDAEFEILDQGEHDELVTSGGDLLEHVLTGWKRVKSEDGADDVPFTPEKKRELLSISYVRVGLLKGYYEAFQGRKAERKNS